jgi:hypothetical protein
VSLLDRSCRIENAANGWMLAFSVKKRGGGPDSADMPLSAEASAAPCRSGQRELRRHAWSQGRHSNRLLDVSGDEVRRSLDW